MVFMHGFSIWRIFLDYDQSYPKRLLLAAEEGNIENVDSLLSAGVNIESRGMASDS